MHVSDTGEAFEIDFVIEDGYYLYKSKLSFASRTPGISIGQYELPTGMAHEDEYFGAQEVYRERFFVSVPYTVQGNRPESAQLRTPAAGLCRPRPVLYAADLDCRCRAAEDFGSGQVETGYEVRFARRRQRRFPSG